MSVDAAAANCVRVDHATVEVVEAMQSTGLSPLLLKGPVITSWLYDGDRTRRAYNDTDLLVAPSQFDRAATVLRRLGYAPLDQRVPRLPHSRPPHADCWYRGADRSAVDLHRCIHGTEWIEPERVWRAATAEPVPIALLGVEIPSPSEAFRLVHAALHLQAKDQPGTRAWTDLERAVRTIRIDRWRDAARLAESLDVDERMGALLARVSGGEAVARQAGLRTRSPLHLRLQSGGRSSAARMTAQILEAPWPANLQLAVDLALPSQPFLLASDPRAAAGPRSLAMAYLRRVPGPARIARGLLALRTTDPDGPRPAAR